MKKTILYAAALLMSATTIAQIPTAGLVAHYPFNGNANDESANSNNGVVNGATLTTDRFGNANSAYNFDGVDDYIEVPHSSALSLDSNTMSISFWTNVAIWPIANEMEDYLFSKQSGVGNSQSGFHVYVHGGNNVLPKSFTYRYRNGTSSNWGAASYSDSAYAVNKWYHVVSSIDDSTGRLYVDGNLVKSDISTVLGTNSSSLIMGNLSNYQGYFNGTIDDVRIYDKAITKEEVSSLYNEGVCFKTVNVTDTLTIYLSQVITSVNEVSQAATTVKVYPNPTAQNLTVEIDNPSNLSGVTLKVLNAQSVEVHNEAVTGSTQAIDVSGWSAGVYFLHVMNGSTTVDIKKIVVNN